MSDIDLIDAVAHVISEDCHEIRRRGFMLGVTIVFTRVFSTIAMRFARRPAA
jgi:hypothetical protein